MLENTYKWNVGYKGEKTSDWKSKEKLDEMEHKELVRFEHGKNGTYVEENFKEYVWWPVTNCLAER